MRLIAPWPSPSVRRPRTRKEPGAGQRVSLVCDLGQPCLLSRGPGDGKKAGHKKSHVAWGLGSRPRRSVPGEGPASAPPCGWHDRSGWFPESRLISYPACARRGAGAEPVHSPPSPQEMPPRVGHQLPGPPLAASPPVAKCFLPASGPLHLPSARPGRFALHAFRALALLEL